MKPIPDPSSSDVLDRMPLTARDVLEIGCTDGALAREYRARNPAATYVGIETDPALAAIARTRLDAVLQTDPEADPPPFAERSFDLIVYNDGLEHLRDPWAALRRHAAQLRPGGAIVLCVPNMEHWSFALRLLRGEWDYAPDGLTDIRHLRWFTRRSLQAGLAQAGLHMQACIPRIFDARAAHEFVQAMTPALGNLRLLPDDLMARAAPLQYLVVATQAPVAPIDITSTMLAPVGGVSHVRVIEPMEALATIPGVATDITYAMADPETDDTPKIFIFHRPAFLDAAGLIPLRDAISRGYLVICEFDDHPDGIPALRGGVIQNFAGVHAVQTSTPVLAEILRAENPEIAVFPNAIRRLPEVQNHAGGPLTLFFAGLNRDEDWPPYVDALNAVASLVGERLQFRIVGDRSLFDALNTKHKSFTPLCDYDTYRGLLAQSEISFMPLRDTLFNTCKSDLKFIEAAAHRVTALASPIAYADTIRDGETGVLFRDAMDLRQRLLRLVVNPEVGQAIGDAARAYVAAERMLAYQLSDRLAWYRDLWARKPALDRALAARRPELFSPAVETPRFGPRFGLGARP